MWLGPIILKLIAALLITATVVMLWIAIQYRVAEEVRHDTFVDRCLLERNTRDYCEAVWRRRDTLTPNPER